MATLTAGIIIIGDEILKGHVHDTNSHYLAKELWQMGIKVSKVSIISDDVADICEEVKLFSSQYDYVLTTGGIGPTHDDRTMEGIANAFDKDLISHPKLVKVLFGDEEYSNDHPWFKMTLVPQNCNVYTFTDSNTCPLIVIDNVYAFPGIPSLMKTNFQRCKHFFTSNIQNKFYLKEIFYSMDEDYLAKPLFMLQDEFETIQIGSYPDDNICNYKVKVTLECMDTHLIETAYQSLLAKVDPSAIINVKSSYTIHDDEINLRESLAWIQPYLSNRLSYAPFSLIQMIHQSMNVIDKAIDMYNDDNLCVAFTGGKDCTVLLELYSLSLKRRGKANNLIKALYVASPNSFTEVETFIDACVARYNLDLIKIPGSIRSALCALKESHPTIQGILMGTRFTDPHSKSLTDFSPTDQGWPQYMRIHCILDWSYSQVWMFLRLFSVPYCTLYDKGYTSIGSTTDTSRNPALFNDDANNGYRPAYSLIDEKLERAGRT
jgi:FAD synthetase